MAQGQTHPNRPYELIAHRAGNTVADLTRVEDISDIVEVDVHLRRGRPEVRHGKILWPTNRLWERWHLLPRDSEVPLLDEILSSVAADRHLWLDLKGMDRRLARAVSPLLSERPLTTVSSKAWWMLYELEGLEGVRRFRSAGNRFERFVLRWLPLGRRIDGVVVNERLLDEKWIAWFGATTGLVSTWAVKTSTRATELVGWGVRGLIIDSPDLLADLKSGRRPHCLD
ncbi:MAG: hypothetical protein GY929_00610 [Actinomycetia bacterium]|nr:hypothetical protein [Actinomycetes bacterium]